MTGSSTLAPARPRLHVEPVGPEHWELGLSVVAAAQVSTGLPRSVAPQDLPNHVLERQRRALGVWLAFACTPEGVTAVGHALVLPVTPDHPVWGPVRDRAVAAALGAGRLAELGGLAVSPGWTGLGVARELVLARIGWLRREGYAGCSSVWRDSPGSLRLARSYGRPLPSAGSATHERFRYA